MRLLFLIMVLSGVLPVPSMAGTTPARPQQMYQSATQLTPVIIGHGNYSDNIPDSTPAVLKVSGEVKTPLSLTQADLAAMSRVNAILKDRDGKEVPYAGVALQEILEKAGVSLGRELRGENLAKYLLVKCSDGYEVLFSLAEIDKAFTDRVIIVAYESMGKPLPAAKGPFRIIVPGEKVPARSSFQVVELVVRFAKD